MLHAPDFLGYPDAIALAQEHRDIVERGLALKKTGNAILEFIGGRAIHPVNVRVGGFYRVPPPANWRRSPSSCAARWTWRWTPSGGWPAFDFPDLELDHDLLSAPRSAAATRSSAAPWRSTSGLAFPASEFPEHVTEQQVPHSTALHATLDAPPLPDRAAGPVLTQLRRPVPHRPPGGRRGRAGPAVPQPVPQHPRPRGRGGLRRRRGAAHHRQLRAAGPARRRGDAAAATGHGVSEAPRGLLYHRYDLDAGGLISAATIVPPTSQNQAAIEDDLRQVATANLDLDDASLTSLCERVIRNYDPCISCATHFLRLTVDRGVTVSRPRRTGQPW